MTVFIKLFTTQERLAECNSMENRTKGMIESSKIVLVVLFNLPGTHVSEEFVSVF